MKKQLLAMLAVASLGVAVAGATPQTQFNKGEFQLDAGANAMKAEANSTTIANGTTLHDFDSNTKWNFQGGLTYGLTDKTALQYQYTGLNVDNASVEGKVLGDASNHMNEVNLVQSLNKNFAVYGGWARIEGDVFTDEDGFRDKNDIAQLGLIAKADLGSKLSVYGKAGIGTKDTTTWEAGLGYKITDDLDLNGGYRYINTRWNDTKDDNITFKGATVGLSYRFGGHTEAPVAAPVYEAPAVVEAPVREAEPNKDYYVQSIHFDSDSSDLKASQTPNLEAMVNAANQYPNNIVKLVGNTDSDANAEYNQALSQRRVQAVAQYAVNHGVAANRLVGLANGENKPVADNATAQGKAENRRVDVFINR